MANEEFSRQIQRLRGANVTIEDMENRAVQFHPRNFASQASSSNPSHIRPPMASNSQPLTIPDIVIPTTPNPDRIHFGIPKPTQVAPRLEKDNRTLEQKQQDRSAAEQLPPWERYLLYSPLADYPIPRESWKTILSKESLDRLPPVDDLRQDKTPGESWPGEARKRKREGDSRSPRGAGSELEGGVFHQGIVDSFGAYRSVSYYDELRGMTGERELPMKLYHDILYPSTDSTIAETNDEFEKKVLTSSWIAKLTPECFEKVETPFDKEEILAGANMGEMYVLNETNKRRKLEEDKAKPTGFRATAIYRMVKATVKFLFTKNS
eukprot:g2524.t1